MPILCYSKLQDLHAQNISVNPLFPSKIIEMTCFFSQVYEMNEEVEKHRFIRDSLELEIQALRRRLSSVESFNDIEAENINAEHTEDQMPRLLACFLSWDFWLLLVLRV